MDFFIGSPALLDAWVFFPNVGEGKVGGPSIRLWAILVLFRGGGGRISRATIPVLLLPSKQLSNPRALDTATRKTADRQVLLPGWGHRPLPDVEAPLMIERVRVGLRSVLRVPADAGGLTLASLANLEAVTPPIVPPQATLRGDDH